MDNPKDARFDLRYYKKFFDNPNHDKELYLESFEYDGKFYDIYTFRFGGYIFAQFGPDLWKGYYEFPKHLEVAPPGLVILLKLKGYL